jgi:Uri superfamily endonuclease
MNQFPPQPGTYGLMFALEKVKNLMIGRLGNYEFPKGMYVYCGSAMGNGGLRSRINHHRKSEHRANPRWHIDWLFPMTEYLNCCYVISDEHMECRWSQTLANQPGARVIVPHFGASDCFKGCLAHLILFPPGTLPEQMNYVLEQVTAKAVEMR